MKYKTKIIILVIILISAYSLFLIPNFNKCVEETGSWRPCIQWLVS